MVFERMMNGVANSIAMRPEDLGNSSELWVGSKFNNLVYAVLTLGPAVAYSKEAAGDHCFNMYPFEAETGNNIVLRRILKCIPLPRGLGNGKAFPSRVVKGPSFIEEVLLSDLQRCKAESCFLKTDALPEVDLTQSAHHFMDSLTPYLYERIRLVANALDGAIVRLATTCSGVESMPSILQAAFRLEHW